jgi:hypothetical protein
MSSPEGSERFLSLVGNPESPPEDIEVIDEYCNQLIREHRNGMTEPGYTGHSPFLEENPEWTDAYLRRGSGWYRIEYYDGTISNTNRQKFSITLQRYSTAYPGATPPRGVEWIVYRDTPEGPISDISYGAGRFRTQLEETWGSLPEAVQRRLGIQDGRHRKPTY